MEMKRKLGEFDEEYILKMAHEQYTRGEADIEIDPKKTALLVVDLTYEFTKPNWTPCWVPEATRQLPKVKKLIETCREVGVTVIYTYYGFHPKGLDLCPGLKWVPIHKGHADFPELFQKESIDPMIKPEYGKDVVIRKYFYGAWTATEIDYVLKNIGVDTVIICGTMTNYCCGATAREAYAHGYLSLIHISEPTRPY